MFQCLVGGLGATDGLDGSFVAREGGNVVGS